METEEKLREYILLKYKSLLKFTQESGIPYGTLQGVLKRGINNSSVNTIISICQALELSADALAVGKIIPVDRNKQTLHLEDVLRDMRLKFENSNVTLSGMPVIQADKERLLFLMEAGIEMIRKEQR